MTHGDQVREIRKKSLWSEIQRLERHVGEIRKCDGDSTEDDPDIKAYRQVIAEKRREYENM